MQKCSLFIIAALCLPVSFAFAQSGAELDALLASGEVSYAQAARFVLPAADLLPAETSPAAAYAAALEKGWLPADATPEAPIRLGSLSFLLMRAFELKGGILYSVFPGPRYAYRELRYLGILQGAADPAQTSSGERLMRILGRALDLEGGDS